MFVLALAMTMNSFDLNLAYLIHSAVPKSEKNAIWEVALFAWLKSTFFEKNFFTPQALSGGRHCVRKIFKKKNI